MIPAPTTRKTPWLLASLALHALLIAVGWSLFHATSPRLVVDSGEGGIRLTVGHPSPAREEREMPEPTAVPTTDPEVAAGPRPPSRATGDLPLSQPPPSPMAALTTPPPPPPSPRLPVSPAEPTEGGDARGGACSPAVGVHCPAPAYPTAAKRAGREGAVRLRLVIAPTGRVAAAVIVESSGRRDFDEAARRTILQQWQYSPARQGAVRVSSEETVRVEFRLEPS